MTEEATIDLSAVGYRLWRWRVWIALAMLLTAPLGLLGRADAMRRAQERRASAAVGEQQARRARADVRALHQRQLELITERWQMSERSESARREKLRDAYADLVDRDRIDDAIEREADLPILPPVIPPSLGFALTGGAMGGFVLVVVAAFVREIHDSDAR